MITMRDEMDLIALLKEKGWKEVKKHLPTCMYLGRCRYFSPENSLCLRPLRNPENPECPYQAKTRQDFKRYAEKYLENP